MRAFSTWALVAIVASHGVVSESSPSVRGHTAMQSRHATEVAPVDFTFITADSVEERSDAVGASSSDGIASSIAYPAPITATPTIDTLATEQPRLDFAIDDSSFNYNKLQRRIQQLRHQLGYREADDVNGSDGDAEQDDDEAATAQPEPDSSTFQSVASIECSKREMDKIYTLYSYCRSAFDLCVLASHYQIFPFQGKHPTQTQIQDMAGSNACVAVFIVVIESNFSACTVGGMPLLSAVETLLKISVDLDQRHEEEAPSVDEFLELVAWRYEVDRAKAAGVPYDSSSELFAEFETNLNAARENTTIRVNEDLSVDVRLPNGAYETFEDAIDLIVTELTWSPDTRSLVARPVHGRHPADPLES
ncbi:hypothetical protein GN958_ATG03110 [Phytophthora infestans]|uniref:Secreted RxLR effector peptide protein n=1 Tax=Phytophthora infestans TaxID=4787 RepID=A0A8S9V3J7_PHYIN|nr:hypothetical protein GN958_ATG03110 [Phytophthora infestans]